MSEGTWFRLHCAPDHPARSDFLLSLPAPSCRPFASVVPAHISSQQIESLAPSAQRQVHMSAWSELHCAARDGSIERTFGLHLDQGRRR